jgi:hypothetical protein
MSIYGEWKDALIDVLVDNDLTAEVDLGRDYDYMQIVIPTIDSAQVSVQVAEKSGGTYQDLGDSVTTDTTTGGYSTVFKIGGWRWIKIKTSAAQTADRTFRVRGSRA